MVLDYLLDNPVVIVLLMVGSGMLIWRARRGSIRVPAAALLIGSTALLIWKVAHANILHHLAGNVVLVLFVLGGTFQGEGLGRAGRVVAQAGDAVAGLGPGLLQRGARQAEQALAVVVDFDGVLAVGRADDV